jgi:hypothetical protein
MMSLSLENDSEVILDGYYLRNGSRYHVNVCIIQFFLVRFYKLCVINFQYAGYLMIWLARKLV